MTATEPTAERGGDVAFLLGGSLSLRGNEMRSRRRGVRIRPGLGPAPCGTEAIPHSLR